MRLTKTVDGVTHTYSLDGDRIVAEEWGNQLLVYFYDDAGLPMGMMYRNSSYADKQFDYYLYEKDVFGNIIAIYNEAGTKVANYCYDAWGNCTVLTNTNGIGAMNPFRYRGYYLDTETNLYYLQSRYYDAYTGRFINADDASNLGIGDELLSYNLFSYCINNPVNDRDDDGQLSWLAKIAIGVAAIAIGAAVTALTGGAALPALVAGVKAACIAGVISAATNATTTAIQSAVSGESFADIVQKSARAAVDGFADGFMAGGITAGVSQIASGGFKIAAQLGAKTGRSGGIKIGNAKILSPDATWHQNNGGTLLKIGKNFRIDVGSNTLLHMHLPGVPAHIQIGTIGAGIYGGLK